MMSDTTPQLPINAVKPGLSIDAPTVGFEIRRSVHSNHNMKISDNTYVVGLFHLETSLQSPDGRHSQTIYLYLTTYPT